METMNIEVSYVNTSDIKKALKGMSKGRAGVNGLSIYLFKDVGDFY